MLLFSDEPGNKKFEFEVLYLGLWCRAVIGLLTALTGGRMLSIKLPWICLQLSLGYCWLNKCIYSCLTGIGGH